MAWIELHQSLWTHRKTILLAANLGIDELYAGAHMAKLWTWALDNAQNGDLSGLPSKVIAFGAGWKGNADDFVQAACLSGWLDESNGSYILHDWYDYAGRLIEKKTANKERMRNKRATNVQRTNDERTAHVQGLPNLTIPNHTLPISCCSNKGSEEFETIMDAYLHAFKKFNMTGAIQGYVQELLQRGSGERFVIEVILEMGERGIGPNLNYMKKLAEGWLSQGISSRSEDKERRESLEKPQRSGQQHQSGGDPPEGGTSLFEQQYPGVIKRL